MSFTTLKWIGGLALAVFLAGGAAWLAGRVDRARQADALEQSLVAERKLRNDAEVANAATSAAIAASDDKVRTVTKTVTVLVPKLVKDNRACDLSPAALQAINKARGYP